MSLTPIFTLVLSNYHLSIADNRKIRGPFGSGSEHYKPDPALLGLETKNGRTKLITVVRRDINCLNLFLRIFGYGKLAHIDYSLKSVIGYLEKFDWIAYNQSSEAQRVKEVYSAVCAIANRWARHSSSRHSNLDGDTKLLDLLSVKTVIKGVTFNINPATEVCDLGNQIRRVCQTRDRKELFASQIYLQGLDRDGDSVDRILVPVTRLQLKDKTVLSSHALVLPSHLDTIDKIQFIIRGGDENTANTVKTSLDNCISSDLTSVTVEKYRKLTDLEEKELEKELLKNLNMVP